MNQQLTNFNDLRVKLKQLLKYEQELKHPAYSYPSQKAHFGGTDAQNKITYPKGVKQQLQEFDQNFILVIEKIKPKFTDIIDIFEGLIYLIEKYKKRMENAIIAQQKKIFNYLADQQLKLKMIADFNWAVGQINFGKSQVQLMKKKIRYFSTLKVLGFIQFVQSTVTKKSEQSLIFIGPTDAGKGTLINYLTDPQNLKGSKNLLGYFTIKKKDDNKNKKFNISSKMVSDTKFPENEVINNRQIFDTAGFLDTRGPHDNVLELQKPKICF